MKRLLFLSIPFLAFCLIAGTNKGNQKNTIEGKYKTFKTNDSETCELEIEITNHRGNYKYQFISTSRNISGRLKLIIGKNEYFGEMIGTKVYESGELVKENSPITIQIENDTITIQNYGNSMNYYVQLNDCDEKYIKLAKSKNRR